MKKALFILMIITLSGFIAVKAADFANGVDVGWLSQMESSGKKFYNSAGVQQDCLQILKDLCVNSIRLRVWVNPTGGWCGKADVVAMAVRAHNMGFRVMLDFHYSDSWADPGKQNKPAAWTGYTFPQLVQAVHDHTNDVLSAVVAAGVIPEWVQVGNETNNGMLWDANAAISGRATDSMSNFAQLVTSGYNAVKAVNSSIKVIVHISNGYDNALFRWIFDGLKNNGGLWDIMGMSLYPDATNTYTTWDPQCLTNMNDMVSRYPGKQVMISEFGYDVTQAQTTHDFAVDLITKVKSVTGNNGLGVFYWEPECYNGWQGYNKGAFDNTGKPTIAMNAFAENCVAVTATATAVTPVLTASPSATQTRTRTSTVTQTRTATPSFTYTSTRVATPNFTATNTMTCNCGTSTYTRTSTYTSTQTRTATATSTITCGCSNSATMTPSNTQTRTSTATPTATGTIVTRTNTPTFSATRTFTETLTQSPVSTVSPTFTDSPVGTPLSATFTPSFTQTLTQYRTFTATITQTLPLFFTFTSTPSFTQTGTRTVDPSRTTTVPSTGTRTATRTNTPTSTITNTPATAALVSGIVSPPDTTVANNITVVITVSNTGSADASNVLPSSLITGGTAAASLVSAPSSAETISAGGAVSFTWIYTATKAGSLSFQSNITGTDSGTGGVIASAAGSNMTILSLIPTPTLTPTATTVWGDKFVIQDILIYPNPVGPGPVDVKMNISITQAAAEITVKIYTVSFRHIMEIYLGAVNTKKITALIPAARIKHLSAGTYYVVVTGRSIGGEKVVSKLQTMIILK